MSKLHHVHQVPPCVYTVKFNKHLHYNGGNTALHCHCVSYRCPNLLSLKLSGCGHIRDQDVIILLQRCRKLRRLHLENCVRITDRILDGVAVYGVSLGEVTVDFCRNITQEGLKVVREQRPDLRLSAERSAGMIPDSKREEKVPLRRTLRKLLEISG